MAAQRSVVAMFAGLAVLSCATRGPKAPPPPVTVQVAPPPDPLAGAVRQSGFVDFWRKQEHLYLGVRSSLLEQPFLFCYEQTRGMGENEPRLNGNNVGHCLVAAFHRNGHTLQLLARNTRFTARPATPEAAAVRDSFSDSLLAAAPILSPTRSAPGTLVVDAGALLLTDLPAIGAELEATYKLHYSLDPPASGFGAVGDTAAMAIVQVSAHYRASLVSSATTATRTTFPGTLVDDRSVFFGLQYRLAALPRPWATRRADDRVGHFHVSRWDYSDDLRPDPRQHFIARWRLERAEPAEVSRPVRPITYWLDGSIPRRYRQTVRDAILAWNPTFERIGWKDAIVVRDAPAGADETRLELPHAVVRWFVQARGRASARGGIATDPRTGEILHAHIVIPDNWMRGVRSSFTEDHQPTLDATGDSSGDACAYGETAAEELGFALELLEGRGDMKADSPEAEAMVQAVLKEVVMHEAGHTLGLTHNFRASTAYSLAQLDDSSFTREHGIAASVMDYNPVNLSLPGKPHGIATMEHPGAYDAWAIEYAYRAFPRGEETAALNKLAARSAEPELTFSNDIDAGGDDDLGGVDPEVNRRDLGSDPLAFARRRFALSRELWARLAARKVTDGESEEGLRRAFDRAFRGSSQAARLAAKYVGGVIHVRDHAGGRPPFAPVPPARQREALALIEAQIFSADSFQVPGPLLNRLAVDGLVYAGSDPAYRLYDNVVALQRGVLAHLLGASVADRLVEMEGRGRGSFALAELHDRLLTGIWSEARAGGSIPPLRRALQRQHLQMIARLALHPAPGEPGDAQSLARASLRKLAGWLQRAKGRAAAPEVRAHLEDSLAEVNRALQAVHVSAG
jgi:hypothetical protein